MTLAMFLLAAYFGTVTAWQDSLRRHVTWNPLTWAAGLPQQFLSVAAGVCLTVGTVLALVDGIRRAQ